MEVDEQGFLEELLSLRRESWETFPPQMNATTDDEMMMLSNGWSTFNCFNEMMITNNPQSLHCFPPSPSLFGEMSSTKSQLDLVSSFNEMSVPFGEDLSFILPEIDNFTFEQKQDAVPTPWFIEQQDDQIVLPSPLLCNDHQPQKLIEDENNDTNLKLEQVHQASASEIQVFETGLERKTTKVKKVEGQPSKNLMAERRRRKRLNDRLSMLRSVVPKISKMDRTSILGDTIDYMKELLDRIKTLRGEIAEMGGSTNNSMDIFKDIKSKEILIRNTPKFEVDRREMDTRVEISCAGKPGLLLSTMTAIEALGLEIQQCVISCFSDFAMQASCSEELEQTKIISSDEIKQALFISAGYGGRFL
ncbi:hypothetical protein C5167_039969 [Papaver somniferum]|uniref:BHLH domain-containing protein n=1 Tax=Papaver somniferum TaxID=3469 RepID=A0A4Y7IH44_PAPSO|nr:transcription factor bHLH93-like [Papaver somniferum]RZC47012.1 hypothetical protein C5167_039969 [Papaver somniferum]